MTGRMEAMKRRMVSEAIEFNQGNLSRTARFLGIGRTTLYRMIRKYEIELKRKDEMNEKGQAA